MSQVRLVDGAPFMQHHHYDDLDPAQHLLSLNQLPLYQNSTDSRTSSSETNQLYKHNCKRRHPGPCPSHNSATALVRRIE